MYARHLADRNAWGEGGGEGLHVWEVRMRPAKKDKHSEPLSLILKVTWSAALSPLSKSTARV
jgi:hypothetical protein